MKKILPILLVIVIFAAGMGVMLYPTIANYVNSRSQTVAIDNYEEAIRANEAYYQELLAQAQAYNERLYQNGGLRLLNEEEKAEYEAQLNLGGDGVMGYIEIRGRRVTEAEAEVTPQPEQKQPLDTLRLMQNVVLPATAAVLFVVMLVLLLRVLRGGRRKR